MLNLSLAKVTAIDGPTDTDCSFAHRKRFLRIENANDFESPNFEGENLSII